MNTQAIKTGAKTLLEKGSGLVKKVKAKGIATAAELSKKGDKEAAFAGKILKGANISPIDSALKSLKGMKNITWVGKPVTKGTETYIQYALKGGEKFWTKLKDGIFDIRNFGKSIDDISRVKGVSNLPKASKDKGKILSWLKKNKGKVAIGGGAGAGLAGIAALSKEDNNE